MKEDIKDRSDLALLVHSFYERIREDELLSPFFLEVIQVNWDTHLPLMVDFWEHVLFHAGSYKGNPIQKHRTVSSLKRIEPTDFARWLEIWDGTVDNLFTGEMAETIKHKANDIARMMQLKLQGDIPDHFRSL